MNATRVFGGRRVLWRAGSPVAVACLVCRVCAREKGRTGAGGGGIGGEKQAGGERLFCGSGGVFYKQKAMFGKKSAKKSPVSGFSAVSGFRLGFLEAGVSAWFRNVIFYIINLHIIKILSDVFLNEIA